MPKPLDANTLTHFLFICDNIRAGELHDMFLLGFARPPSIDILNQFDVSRMRLSTHNWRYAVKLWNDLATRLEADGC